MSNQPGVPTASARPFMVVGTSARDYRGFEELEFSSWSGVNLLIGQNGAGKSALLRLIATGLCRFAQQLSAVDSPIEISKSDVRSGLDFAGIKAGPQRLRNHPYLRGQLSGDPWKDRIV